MTNNTFCNTQILTSDFDYAMASPGQNGKCKLLADHEGNHDVRDALTRTIANLEKQYASRESGIERRRAFLHNSHPATAEERKTAKALRAELTDMIATNRGLNIAIQEAKAAKEGF